MSQEINYKADFVEKYFGGKKNCDYDINTIDITLKDKKGEPILYIESKYKITDYTALRAARAQIILTNKKQAKILHQVALIYKDEKQNDILELISCDDSVMFNNDINWRAETPSNPSRDAIDRISDRLENKIKIYENDEIKDIYKAILKNENQIHITLENSIIVYHAWLNNVQFEKEVKNEQDLINLFLVDVLDGAKYEKEIDFMGGKTKSGLIREGTNLNEYKYATLSDGSKAITYKSELYTIKSAQKYNDFWSKYKRPPHIDEFLRILEHSAHFYTDNYRKATGGEYTPFCFVELQNTLLKELNYNMDDFLVFDPCAGVGNLQNQFGKDYKSNCYLSTLEQMDVDTCLIKGFENSLRFDYLADSTQPKFDFGGSKLDITEICRRSGKKLMVIMNPPYQNIKGFKHDLAIEFFIKATTLAPDVIVYYCKTEFFFRDSIKPFLDSGYKIAKHVFTSASVFGLSEWSASLVIFDKNKGEVLDKDRIKAERYTLNPKTQKLESVKDYVYDFRRPCLIDEIDSLIKENQKGMILGQYSKLNSVLIVSNGGNTKPQKITTQNLKYCLFLKGLNINSHAKYFEWAYLVFRGEFSEISSELFGDAIAFSLFYKGNLFSNKTAIVDGEKVKLRNFIMPFTHEQLNCPKGVLNVLYPDDAQFVDEMFDSKDEKPFDFREFLAEFEFSKEAKDLFSAGLEIFRYYHARPEYENKDYNDSFYDITNAIMGKNPSDFGDLSSKDSRITKVKSTKGTKGFGRNTIKSVVPSEFLGIFYHFFEMRDRLARKINAQLLESGLLLWQRENIY